MAGPNGQTYRLETLLDVWNLEDPDRIERALREISIGMVHARLYQQALLATIHEEHPELRVRITDWPGFTDWTDDGRGEISLRHTHEGGQIAEVKITVDHNQSEG